MTIDRTPGDDPRALWQQQPTEDFRMSRELLDRYVSTSHRRLRTLTTAQYAGTAAGLAASLWFAVVLDATIMRVGAMLMAMLFVFVLVLLYRAPRTRDVEPAIANPSIESYRSDLERHRTLFSGFRLWSRLVFGVPVAVVSCLGAARTYPALERIFYLELAAILVVLSVTVAKAHRKVREYQEEIDELGASMGER